MKKLYLVILLILNFSTLFSQEIDSVSYSKTEYKYDTSRILDLSDKLGIYTGLSGKIHSIELNNTDLNKKLQLEPNGKTSIGIGFNYKWIGLGVSFSPGFINKDDEIYGETENFDFQLNMYSRAYGIDAYLQYYKGFYLKNPKSFIDWNNDSYPLRPDLESLSFGLSGYYFFNHKNFSYKAAFTRNQIQKKSAGTFILGGFIDANVASAPGGFIPGELPDSLHTYYNIDAHTTSAFGVSFGYTYTLVFLKRFFINASLVPALGVRNAEYWVNDVNTKLDATLSLSLAARIALGYEGKHIYAGLTFVSFVDSYSYETLDISSSAGNIQLFIGKRFNVKNLFNKKSKSTY